MLSRIVGSVILRHHFRYTQIQKSTNSFWPDQLFCTWPELIWIKAIIASFVSGPKTWSQDLVPRLGPNTWSRNFLLSLFQNNRSQELAQTLRAKAWSYLLIPILCPMKWIRYRCKRFHPVFSVWLGQHQHHTLKRPVVKDFMAEGLLISYCLITHDLLQ